MNIRNFIKWTNDNSGFLSLILFALTFFVGWVSGFFKSLITKPKIKVRFIDKASFYTFFPTGNTYHHPELHKTFELHQTAFAVYMSIANIGNMPTSIDKIYLGYYKNTGKGKFFKRPKKWLAQWHIFENFRFEYNNHIILIPPLRTRNEVFTNSTNDNLGIGESTVGVAYFEQEEAWGNLNPKVIDETGKIRIIIKIRDIYGRYYKFKTILKPISLENARKINPEYGKVSKTIRNEQNNEPNP